ARWSRGNDGPRARAPIGAAGARRAPGDRPDEFGWSVRAADWMGAHGILLLPGGRRAPLRVGPDGGPVQAPLRRRALRRLVLARGTSGLELGLRRLAIAAASRRLVLAGLGVAVLAIAGMASVHGAEPRPRVVATLPDLFVLTRAVAGDLATIELVARF